MSKSWDPIISHPQNILRYQLLIFFWKISLPPFLMPCWNWIIFGLLQQCLVKYRFNNTEKMSKGIVSLYPLWNIIKGYENSLDMIHYLFNFSIILIYKAINTFRTFFKWSKHSKFYTGCPDLSFKAVDTDEWEDYDFLKTEKQTSNFTIICC